MNPLRFRFIGTMPDTTEEAKMGDVAIQDGKLYLYFKEWLQVEDPGFTLSKIKYIVKFINDFKSEDEARIEYVFSNGLCYWFAKILQDVFGGEIVYNNKINHFALKIENTLFDVIGIIPDGKDYVSWEKYKTEIDTTNGYVVERDCIFKVTSPEENLPYINFLKTESKLNNNMGE